MNANNPCRSRKRGYRSMASAFQELHKHQLGRGNVYECPMCKRWHLTTQEPPQTAQWHGIAT